MVIENAERFGLSQLHQLRGRVGRGEHQSTCYLVALPRGDDSFQRIQAMIRTNNGFRIAEADLNIRGPGEFFGTRQSGIPNFKIANIIHDATLLEAAKSEAGTAHQSRSSTERICASVAEADVTETLARQFGNSVCRLVVCYVAIPAFTKR